MSNTLYLNPSTWDLAVDLNGNIAMATDDYALAQDVSSSVKLWLGELFYDTTQGVSWFNIYGNLPPMSYVRAQIQAAALSVPGIASATVFFSSFSQRLISGQVQVIDDEGILSVVTF